MSETVSMSFHTCNQDGISYSVCDHLAVPHGLFTRHGGVSEPPYASLNCGNLVGDAPDNVAKNREKMAWVFGLDEIKAVTQVHGDRVVVITDPAQETWQEQADAMLTDIAGIGLLIQQADCQSILLYDPVRRVIGAVHSGWRGSVANIIGKTIATMKASFSCTPADIQAVISPSLGPCCAEFIHYKDELPESMHPFHVGDNRFDFWAISHAQLESAGLRPEKIWVSGHCTMCNHDYFSHRRSTGKGKSRTGRNGSIIALPA